MTGKVVSFGCSYTVGESLSDNQLQYALTSKFAWPEICANLLKIDCDNKAVGGSSNLEILYAILKYDNFDPNDTVFVMWSHFDRDVIFTSSEKGVWWGGNLWQWSPGPRINQHPSAHIKVKELTHHWLNVHNEYDVNMRSWFYIHHANSYFLSKNLKFYHLFHPNTDFTNLLTVKKPNFIKLNNVVPLELNAIDSALDNAHPGEQSHLKFGTWTRQTECCSRSYCSP